MCVTTLPPSEVVERLNTNQDGLLIDVRTPVEFASVHVPGARNIPLDRLDPRALRSDSPNQPLYVICKSGSRASKACEQLRAAGCGEVIAVDGGIDAWIREGLPVERRAIMTLERQVRIGAGLLVLIGVVLGVWVNPWWLVIAAFVGAGLVFAGLTDFCGMALLLAKAPWNRYEGPVTSCKV